MNPLHLPEVLQDCLAVFEGYRRLGFLPDDIYLAVNGPLKGCPEIFGKYQLLMELHTQGVDFSVSCGVTDWTPALIQDAWNNVALAMTNRTVSQAALDQIWNNSSIRQSGHAFVQAIIGKGIVLPCALTHASSSVN